MTDSVQSAPCLQVLTGLHSGARVALDAGQDAVTRIGSGAGNDLILQDPGIGNQHFSFYIRGPFISVEAADGAVSVNGEQIIPGNGFRCRLPVSVQVADIQLSIALPEKIHTGLQGWIRSHNPLALLLTAALLLFVPAIGVGISLAASDDVQERSFASGAAAGTEQPEPVHATQVLDELQDHLNQQNLSHLQALLTGDGSLTVSGAITVAGEPDWKQVQSWFDGRYSGQFLLRSRVRVLAADNEPDISVAAVWLGAEPCVIDNSGHRLKQGSELDDGWILEKVHAQGLDFSRAGDSFHLSLAQQRIAESES